MMFFTETLELETPFSGELYHEYTFRVRARDLVGHTSDWITTTVAIVNQTKYYFLDGRRIAMRKGDKVYYLYGDHLGSTSLATDENGVKLSESRYLPYGGGRLNDGISPTDFGFTDQRNEVGLGLVDYHARYYDPYLGRFISPDTIVPEPESSSGLNRYRYARNNPLKYNDPSGHCVGLALGMDTAFCIAVGKIVVDIAVVAIATYLIVDSTQEIGQTINDLPLNQVNPPVTSGGFEGEAQPPFTEEISLLEGNQATVETIPANPSGNSSILDPFERPANWPTILMAKPTSDQIAIVEHHLSRFGEDPPNAAMIERLKAGMWDKNDQVFFEHEMMEYQLMEQGINYNEAHQLVLVMQGIPYEPGFEASIYHHDVIKQYPEYFSPEAQRRAGVR